MKSPAPLSLRAAALAAAPLLLFALSSCQMTGDPMEDSLFFSRDMANTRLHQKSEQLYRLRQETASEDIRARTMRHKIVQESARQSADDAQIASLKRQIDDAKGRRDAAQQDVDQANTDADEARAAIRRRNEAQAEVSRLTGILQLRLRTE